MPETEWVSFGANNLIDVSPFTAALSGFSDVLDIAVSTLEFAQNTISTLNEVPPLAVDVTAAALDVATTAITGAMAGFDLGGGAHLLFVPASQQTWVTLSTQIADTFGNLSDVHRPRYSDTAAAAGAVIALSAADYLKAKDVMLRMVNITKNPNSEIKRQKTLASGVPTFDLPTPQNLRAVPTLSSTGTPSVTLTWDPFLSNTTSTVSLAAPKVQYTISNVRIGRDTQPIDSGRYNTGLYSDDYVEFSMPFPGIGGPGLYEDTTVTDGELYSYFVCYDVTIDGEIIDPILISNVVELLAAPLTNAVLHSPEPYWVVAEGLLPAMFPGFQEVMDYLQRLINNFVSTGAIGVDNVATLLDDVFQGEIDRLNALIREISANETLLANIAAPMAGATMASFAFYTTEGVPGIQTSIYTKMQDDVDPNRPSDDDTFIGAVVLVAGSDNVGEALAAYNILAALFGGPSDADPELLTALESINSVIGVLEAEIQEFDSTLSTLGPPAVAPPTEPTLLELP